MSKQSELSRKLDALVDYLDEQVEKVKSSKKKSQLFGVHFVTAADAAMLGWQTSRSGSIARADAALSHGG